MNVAGVVHFKDNTMADFTAAFRQQHCCAAILAIFFESPILLTLQKDKTAIQNVPPRKAALLPSARCSPGDLFLIRSREEDTRMTCGFPLNVSFLTDCQGYLMTLLMLLKRETERKVCTVVFGRGISAEYYGFDAPAKHLLDLPLLSSSFLTFPIPLF